MNVLSLQFNWLHYWNSNVYLQDDVGLHGNEMVTKIFLFVCGEGHFVCIDIIIINNSQNTRPTVLKQNNYVCRSDVIIIDNPETPVPRF